MTEQAPAIRVVIVDDHELVREALTNRLRAAPYIGVVGEASNLADATAMLNELRPDVIVLDIELPDGNGLDLCRNLDTISPTTRCVIHSGADVDQTSAADAGVSRVVLKELRHSKLVEAIYDAVDFDRSLMNGDSL